MHDEWIIGLTLFLTGSGTYVVPQGGAIMAQVFLRRHRFTQRPPTTLNLLPDKYFDLWLSIDTKNSPLCGILLRLRAVKWRWSKMKIFKRKKVEISNFGLQKCYIPQTLRIYLVTFLPRRSRDLLVTIRSAGSRQYTPQEVFCDYYCICNNMIQ